MKPFKQIITLLLVAGLITITSCGDDDSGPNELTIVSVVATGTDPQTGNEVSKDLNAATAAEDVPVDLEVVVTFSRDLDETSVTASSITISDGTNSIAVTPSVSGAVVTLTTASELETGTSYTITLSGTIAAADGGSFTEISRTFATVGRPEIDPPLADSQLAYFKLDGSADDELGNLNNGTTIGITYAEDRFGNVNTTALFDGNTSIIEIPDGDDLLNEKFTVSFWVLTDTTDHLNANGDGNAGHFVMGVAVNAGFYIEFNGSANSMAFNARYSQVDGTNANNGMFFNGDGQFQDSPTNPGGWIGIEFEADLREDGEVKGLLAQKWAHVVMTYDGSINKRSMYINGELMETDDLERPAGTLNFNGLIFDPDVEDFTYNNILALGFGKDRNTTKWDGTGFGDYSSTTSNHFKGQLDDVRFFSEAYTQADVTALYTAEKP